MQKLFITIAFLFLIIASVSADELSEGYAAFAKNDLTQARQHFTAATQVKNSQAEAYIMLSLISSVNQNAGISFAHFLNFYKTSSNPIPYTMALWHQKSVIGYDVLKSRAQVKFMEEVMQRPDADCTLKAYATEDLAKYYESTGDIKKSKELFARIGAVMNWQIAGDFENISASGFDKNYSPVSQPEPDAVFTNKIGAGVKWFNLYKQVPGKWIDFTNNFYCNNSLIYAQSFCQSPEDQTVFFRIGTSGSLKVWVNDHIVYSIEDERNNGIDTYVFPVKIAKGNNRILLQIGCSEINQCNFMFRVTDQNGKLADNLSFTETYSLYNKTAQDIAIPVTSVAESFLSQQIEQYPDKLVNYIALANAYLANDKTHQAMDVLNKALKIAPDCSFLLLQLSELYIREKNRTSYSLTNERIKQVDPNSPVVINALISDAFDAENYKEVRELIEKKEKLYGTDKDLYYNKVKLASSEKKVDEFTSLVDEAFAKYPDDYTCVYYKYILEKKVKQDQNAAIKVLKDYLKKNFNKAAMGILSDEYFQSGHTAEGVELVKKLIEVYPFSDSYYKYLGVYYTQAGNPASGKPYLEECLKIAPYYGPYHGNYAKALDALGDKQKTMEEYKLNIAYQPDDYNAINKLRTLQSKKLAFDYFPTKDYYQIYKNAPSATDYPSDNILSLAEDKQLVLYENGGAEARQVYLYKALTLKGIDYLKEYTIDYSSGEKLVVEKAEVLKKNGNRLQAEVNDNQIVFTSLEPGDAILLIYKKQKQITGSMSKNYAEKTLFSTWYPSTNIEYNLLAENKVKFDYKAFNSDIKPVISDNGDFKLYTWRKAGNKSIVVESNMPTMLDFSEVLNISTIPDWDYLSKWYFDISNTKTKPGTEVKEVVKTLLSGKENLSEYERARILYNYIEQNIRYSSVSFRQNGVVPQKASDVLITRIGDCKDLAVLFTSMCREAGIKAGITLVSRRQNGNRSSVLPSFDFDHAIGHATLDGKEYYIELTSSSYPFATIGTNLKDALVLNVNNDLSQKTQAFFLNPPTRKPANVYRNSVASFNGENLMKTVSTARTGEEAAYIRETYRDLGKDEREKKFTEAIAADYSNTKLTSLDFNQTLNDCSDTVTYNYAYTAPRVFSNISDLSIVKLPLTDPLAPMDFLSFEERNFPIEIWQYDGNDTVSEKLTIRIPENKKLAELPKSVSYRCKEAFYTLNFKLAGKELLIERTFGILKDMVDVADYKEYRNFIEMVVKADTQQIGFR